MRDWASRIERCLAGRVNSLQALRLVLGEGIAGIFFL
jgi:hypothetical protein